MKLHEVNEFLKAARVFSSYFRRHNLPNPTIVLPREAFDRLSAELGPALEEMGMTYKVTNPVEEKCGQLLIDGITYRAEEPQDGA